MPQRKFLRRCVVDKPLVSVVIPCKNSEEFIGLTLRSLESQTYKNVEVIVVDNYSIDDTEKIARQFKVKYICQGPERATQDNVGIMEARGELIWLTGSDMVADDKYIEEAVAKIQEGYDAIYASVLTDHRVRHFWGKVKALERKCYIGDNVIESARFFKKSVWEHKGGFDEGLVQIEEDFQHWLDSHGYKTGRIGAREFHLHEDDSLKSIWKKSVYYGKFMSRYLRVHKARGYHQLMPLRMGFLRNWKLLLKHPVLTGGLIIYKVVQYTGGLYALCRNRK
jgi:glycosyltransferase involved in cell wall biosynthesis